MAGTPVCRPVKFSAPYAAFLSTSRILFAAIIAHPVEIMRNGHALADLDSADVGRRVGATDGNRPSIAVLRLGNA